MNELQRSVLAAIEDAREDQRQQARIRYHLKKRNMKLYHDRKQGPLVICRTTWMLQFQGSLDEIEAWAKGGAR